ncbi:MAG: LEA type 2 family protein [Bacteroidota bacterium]
MKKIILGLLFASMFVFQACKDLKEVQCMGVNKFKLNSINAEAIDADIYLKLKNPNPFGFTIGKSEFDVTYGGIKVGKAKLVKGVKIQGNAEDVYAFKLQSNFKNVLSLDNVMNLLQAVNQAGVVELKGNLNVKKGFVSKAFPITFNQKINID